MYDNSGRALSRNDGLQTRPQVFGAERYGTSDDIFFFWNFIRYRNALAFPCVGSTKAAGEKVWCRYGVTADRGITMTTGITEKPDYHFQYLSRDLCAIMLQLVFHFLSWEQLRIAMHNDSIKHEPRTYNREADFVGYDARSVVTHRSLLTSMQTRRHH